MNLPFQNKITTKNKAFLARQISTMIASGLPLNKAMGILADQERNPKLKEILIGVLENLEAGAPFSTAAAKYPILFDKVFINIVVSGETVGKLSEVLGQLADQYEKEGDFNGKVSGAFAYPAFIIVAMLLVGGVMMVYIVPQLQSIFEEANAALPLPTRVIISVSNFLKNDWLLLLIGLIAAFFLLRAYFRSAAGTRVVDGVTLRIPGNLGVEIYMTRMSQTLGMLVQAGTPIIEALNVTADVMNNVYYQDLLRGAVAQVKRGIPLSVPVSESTYFPPIVSQMISVGEQTGQLDKILLNLGQYYQREVDDKLKNVSTLIEPIIIVIVGVGVGFLVYAILMPIYSIAQLQ
jgi:type IV pilus assembly protein PilC